MASLNPYLSPILDELEQLFNKSAQSSEHSIIKHLQDKQVAPFTEFSLAEPKALFSAHFLCMHALYHLQQHYRKAGEFKLIITSVRVERIKLTAAEITEQPLSNSIDIIDPLASYYLNSAHYFNTQEDEIHELLKSFWQKYLAQDDKKSALEVLALPPNADKKMLKAQYLKLANKYHPDKGGCGETFNKINAAKATLDKIL